MTAQTLLKGTYHLLPDLHPWASRSSWTVLDTGLGDGKHLWEWAARWRADAQRPLMLHLVGFGFDTTAFRQDTPSKLTGTTFSPDEDYRLHLEGGSISVTLCKAEVVSALRSHTFKADAIFLRAHAAPWVPAAFNALARHCIHGTTLQTEEVLPWQHQGLLAAGFCEVPALGEGCYQYAPAWTPKVRGNARDSAPPPPGTCAVIGAGIAGASAAHALAVRGWDVTVYDRAAEPAAGASGLPAGLVVAHVSKDDSPRSRLSRAGVRLVHAFAQDHLAHGTDWAHTGVMEQRWDATGNAVTPLWHPEGAWVKPARLVQAWLSHPNIRFAPHCNVASIRSDKQRWALGNDDGQPHGTAQVVVFANAFGCASLIQNLEDKTALASGLSEKLNALHCLHGTLSMGSNNANAEWDRSAWPAYPCNGDGSFLAGIPTEQGTMWAAGSTFEKQAERINDIAQQHASNAARLKQLLPVVGTQLQSAFASTNLSHWSGSRCVSHDRFALVGPLESDPQPTLWISAAMGSRGLSFAALCAELLAARLCGEPLPVSDRLARNLDVLRGFH